MARQFDNGSRCITGCIVFVSMVAFAGATRSQEPTYVEGIVAGGLLSESEKARLHFTTEILPPSADEYSTHAPEAIETEEGHVRKLITYSKVYEIDQIYRSMQGPQSAIRVLLGAPDAAPELVWIKAVHTEVVGESGQAVSQEYMCHLVAALDDAIVRDDALATETTDLRFGTMSQGLSHKSYPLGFGLPALSTHFLSFHSQVLNLNREDANVRVRHRVITHYIRDSERAVPMKAIDSTYAQVMVLLNEDKGEGYYGVRVPNDEIAGSSCSVGQHVESEVGLLPDSYGRQYSAHWVVEPGTTENRALATKLMKIRYDTTIHAIDVHLHPFAEWVELRDLTARETVFRSKASQIEHGIGLASVESFRSAKGLPVYSDHEYAIVAGYDNTSGENQDAMAVMYVGTHDKRFDASLLGDPVARTARRRDLALERLRRLAQAVLDDPEDGLAHARLGAALLGEGDVQAAAVEFRTAQQLGTPDPQMAKNIESAIAVVQALLAGQP